MHRLPDPGWLSKSWNRSNSPFTCIWGVRNEYPNRCSRLWERDSRGLLKDVCLFSHPDLNRGIHPYLEPEFLILFVMISGTPVKLQIGERSAYPLRGTNSRFGGSMSTCLGSRLGRETPSGSRALEQVPPGSHPILTPNRIRPRCA